MTPYFKQEKIWTCGPAAMRMILASFGIKRSEKQLIRLLKTNKIKGTSNKDLIRVADHFDFNFFVEKDGKISDLRKFLSKNYKIIIAYFYERDRVDHYAVVRKIDRKNIYLLDSWAGRNHKYSLDKFMNLWLKYSTHDRERGWFIALRLNE